MKTSRRIAMIESYAPYSWAQMRYLKQEYPDYKHAFICKNDDAGEDSLDLLNDPPQLLILPGGEVYDATYRDLAKQIKEFALSGGNIMAVCSGNYIVTDYHINAKVESEEYTISKNPLSMQLFGGATMAISGNKDEFPQIKYSHDFSGNKIACLYYNGPFFFNLRLEMPTKYEVCETILRLNDISTNRPDDKISAMIRKKLPGGGNLVLSTFHSDHSFQSEIASAKAMTKRETPEMALHEHSSTRYLSQISALEDEIEKTEDKMQAIRNYVYEDIFGLKR